MSEMSPEEIEKIYERQDWGIYASLYHNTKSGDIKVGNKLILIGKFLTSQSNLNMSFYPTNAIEATQVFDLVAIILGYTPKTSVIYKFNEIRHGITGVIPTKLPTLDLHSYEKNGNILYQVLFYPDSASHYNHLPNSSKVMVNIENPDFNGTEFNTNSLSEPLPTFLRNEIGNTKVKEIDRLEILKKILAETVRSMGRFDGDWKELVEGCFIR